jgi:iron(III) transport system substrate-binding protein
MNRRCFLRLAAAAPWVVAGCRAASPRVVMYCAQDREFADGVLNEFTNATGLRVDTKFDTEANKSVSLYEEIVREARRPRCDVHWNNEILATIRLWRQGLLEPYDSPSAAPFPDWAKAHDHAWHAFAARARVLVVNTNLVAEADRPRRMQDLTDPRWKGRIAMAKPMFGTTATHAACLFAVWGRERAERFYRDLKANDVRIVAGNKQVAVEVAGGECALGVTDTDDAIIEREAGRPVALIFPDAGDLGTLFIPNTLALIRGGPNSDGGRKLIDFLLGESIERRLAETASRQIPLNPAVKATLPPDILTPAQVNPMKVDFEKAADVWDESQRVMRQLFAR